MRIFLANSPNTFHYITIVAFDRLPIFNSDRACSLFIETLSEIKLLHPFKLVGYVIMPDHVHLIINPQNPEISVILRKLKGKSARLILDWLITEHRDRSLEKLRITAKDRQYAVWQKDSSLIDLISPKFLRQKLDYIHLNPVRARLCDAPHGWRWSSYNAYLPAGIDDAPIKVDLNPYWRTV